MPLRAILFDKDGTLVDFDKTWSLASYQVMLAVTAKGGSMQRLADAIDYDLAARQIRRSSPMVASSTGDYAHLWAGAVDEVADDVFLTRLDALFIKNGLAYVTPIGDPMAVVRSLKAQGYLVGVLTNDSEAGARAQCEKLGLTADLDIIVGYDTGHGRKPDPDPLHAIAGLIGVDVSEMALVGDTLHDLHAARAAGVVGIGVLSGHTLREELAPHADHIIDDIMSLPDLLTRIA